MHETSRVVGGRPHGIAKLNEGHIRCIGFLLHSRSENRRSEVVRLVQVCKRIVEDVVQSCERRWHILDCWGLLWFLRPIGPGGDLNDIDQIWQAYSLVNRETLVLRLKELKVGRMEALSLIHLVEMAR